MIRKISIRSITVTAAGLALFVGCAVANAAVRKVGNSSAGCTGPAYSTISAAVAAAKPYDEIQVCPGLYPEQVVITVPLTLRGIEQNGYQRVLIQPTTFVADASGDESVIAVLNTYDVEIDDLAIDASLNTVSGCSPVIAGIHFWNSSGKITNSAISGTQVGGMEACAALLPGNGLGIVVDEGSSATGKYKVSAEGNSIHDFNRNGIFVEGPDITFEAEGNSISGVGPSTGSYQFGIFIFQALASIKGNFINQGTCGGIDPATCFNNSRSEGIVFRAAADGSKAEGNSITNAQVGIFLNGGNKIKISNNLIMNIDGGDGIWIQGSATGYFTNSIIEGNSLSHMGAVNDSDSVNGFGCGIAEISGSGVANNVLSRNSVNDAYCGILYVSADSLSKNKFANALYEAINGDLYPVVLPPASEP